MKVLLWMPTIDGKIPVDTMLYLFSIQTKHELGVVFPARTPISLARNQIIDKAIREWYDYVRWLDDDNPPLTPTMLDELLESWDDIVSALVPSRLRHKDWEYKRCVYEQRDPITPKHLTIVPTEKKEIDTCGLWCCVTSVKCLSQVSQNFPAPCESATQKYYRINDKFVHEDFVENPWDSLRTHCQLSEDLILMDRLKNLWYKIYAKPLFCKHLSSYYVTPNDVPSFSDYTSSQWTGTN